MLVRGGSKSKGRNIKFKGAELTLMESLVQFNYSELSLKGHSQIRRGRTQPQTLVKLPSRPGSLWCTVVRTCSV